MFRKLITTVVLALSANVASAGLLGDYMSDGGTLTSTVGYVDFVEYDAATDPGTGTFAAGDIVYIYQKFSTAGLSGAGSAPASLYGIWAFQGTSTVFDNNEAFVANRPGIELSAVGQSTFQTHLDNLGIARSDVTIGANSSFVLVSSANSVDITSTSSFTGQGFEVDLVAGFGTGNFAEFQAEGLATDMTYAFYNQTTDGSNAFRLAFGMTIEDTDDDTNLAQPTGTATGFQRNGDTPSSTVGNLLLVNTPATTTSFKSSTVWDGQVAMSLSIPNSVPEPSSIMSIASIFALGFASRRRRK